MNARTLTNKARNLGYIVRISEVGEILGVMPIDPNGYTPEIYREDPRAHWELIQTTGYGAKTSDEITQVIEGLQNAQRMIGLLRAWYEG